MSISSRRGKHWNNYSQLINRKSLSKHLLKAFNTIKNSFIYIIYFIITLYKVYKSEVLRNRANLLYVFSFSYIYFLSDKKATPGNSLPSNNSKEAPPPVETWEILSVTPYFLATVAVSPPPIMTVLPL